MQPTKTPDSRQLAITSLKVKNASSTILSVDAFDCVQGDLVGIQGPSGAGKSTFLNAIAGLNPLATGRVLWDGQDILSLPDRHGAAFRRNTLGLVFQDFRLFDELSALENAAIAARYVSHTTADRINQQAALMLETLGLDPAQSRPASRYSGGERQRIAVARALSTQPSAILADEPTANLDKSLAQNLTDDLIATARNERTSLILVSHDTYMLAQMDRVVTIENGVLHD